MSPIRRRHFVIVAIALLAAPSSALAQQTRRIYRVGWLSNSPLNTPEVIAGWDVFRLELQRLGWEQGRNLEFEQRFAAGNAALYPQYVREMIDAKVDVIVSTTGPGTLAAKKVTSSIPIVFSNVPAPVENGLVESLARPGGNVTGFSTGDLDLISKRMELLKEAFPRTARVAYLPGPRQEVDALTSRVAQRLGLLLMPAKVETPDDLPSAIALNANADAWFVSERFFYFSHRGVIIEQIARQRKPAMYPSTFFVDAGGLMSYSVDQKDLIRRVAGYVDRILKGASPADLPVQQPTKYELAVNLKAARSLDLTIPKAVLLRADRVIE